MIKWLIFFLCFTFSYRAQSSNVQQNRIAKSLVQYEKADSPVVNNGTHILNSKKHSIYETQTKVKKYLLFVGGLMLIGFARGLFVYYRKNRNC